MALGPEQAVGAHQWGGVGCTPVPRPAPDLPLLLVGVHESRGLALCLESALCQFCFHTFSSQLSYVSIHI